MRNKFGNVEIEEVNNITYITVENREFKISTERVRELIEYHRYLNGTAQEQSEEETIREEFEEDVFNFLNEYNNVSNERKNDVMNYLAVNSNISSKLSNM